MRQEISPVVPLYFFGRAPSHTLHIAPLHLPQVDPRINRIADIVKYICAQDRVQARQRVEQNFGDRHPEGEVMERLATPFLLVPADARRFIKAGGAEADLTEVEQRHGIPERNRPRRMP